MARLSRIFVSALIIAVPLQACSSPASATTPAPAMDAAPQERPEGRGGPDGGGKDDSDGPGEYSEVITEDAITQPGMFDVHHVDEDIF
ncbi:MAG: DUF5118 domain-containing protein, partial [Longimicrobiales bacterium]